MSCVQMIKQKNRNVLLYIVLKAFFKLGLLIVIKSLKVPLIPLNNQ